MVVTRSPFFFFF